ncbi:DUF2127 domain-containing protein [Actinocatenispora thailandica]|nr:DUF2127 domain-containing protein [Actinocatenispora thailandica]
MDWNLRACARRGHVTYAPAEAELRDRLCATTPQGEAWRCLRCGTYAVGAPAGGGPADHAPLIPRGAAIRDRLIIRILAVERFLRGLLIAAAALAVWWFRDSQVDLSRVFESDLPLVRPLADKFGYDLTDSPIVDEIRKSFTLSHTVLLVIAAALLGYALIELVEGVGLWLVKRWAEYFTVVATAAFLPLEIYELSEKFTWLRIGALLFNVVAVIYLLVTKRLFGLRGGADAAHAALLGESLLEVERAAV